MNYMGHYVGSTASISAHPLQTIALAWHPWAVVRIASFVTLGVLFAGPVLSRVVRFRYKLNDHGRILGLAISGLVLDLVLKWMLAPVWARFIRESL